MLYFTEFVLKDKPYTGKSQFKKLRFSSLKSSHIWFQKDFCTKSKNQSSEKMFYVGEFAS